MPDIISSEWIRDQIMNITKLCERIVTKVEEQDHRIDKIEKKVEDLCEKPGKRWETVVTAVLTGIVGALIVAYFSIPKA